MNSDLRKVCDVNVDVVRRYVSGLMLELGLGQDDYVGELGDTAGAVVLVHDQGALPFPEDDGIFLMPGKATSLGIQQVSLNCLVCPIVLYP